MNKTVTDLKSQIRSIDASKKAVSAGIITQLGDGVAIIDGLSDITAGEIIDFPHGVRGMALNLNFDSVGAIILGDDSKLKQGDIAKTTGDLLSIPVDENMLGRVVNPLGDALDGKALKTSKTRMPLESIAPGVIAREPVNAPLQTGIKAIDSMIPIGRGQRELIIGDRSTGKSAVALTTIINQKVDDVICIYVSIGQKRSFTAQTIGILQRFDSMANTIIVAASASDPASMQFLAPYAGVSIAEYFAQKGKDVLVVYDDLTKHAWSYREVSLLLRRPSGREAYPGDVFYLHSRLLERAVKLNKDHGGGSITALPIIETQAGDVSAYIPTNVISITDGQIFLDTDMFNAGQRPAINLGISVSRVGGAAQIKAMKKVVGSLKIDMAQFRELAAFAQFSSDLDPKTKAQLERGQRITEVLKQGWDEPLPVEVQIVIFWAINQGFIDKVQIEKVKDWENQLISHLKEAHSKTLDTIVKKGQLDASLEKKLHTIIKKFNQDNAALMIQVEEENKE